MTKLDVRDRDLISISDLSPDEVWGLLQLASKMKGVSSELLKGKTLALLFEKPSLRTRVSFDVAMKQLGGSTIYLGPDEVGTGKREAVSDIAQVLSRYVDIIAARTFLHHTVEQLAQCAPIPVINALSDREHPCQALGDLLTIQEKLGRLKDVTIAFIGDGNNVATSLALATVLVGGRFLIASPKGYELPAEVIKKAHATARDTGGSIQPLVEPSEAVRGAEVVYTDVWVSMGEENEAEKRRRDFSRYQVDVELMSKAKKGAIFLHPMPAHYGEEVPSGFLEQPFSVAYQQAENRMHIQKAILAFVLAR